MTTWRDQLQPASFRGVAFRVDTAELTGGRTVVKYDYPFKDQWWVEDLGRKGRGFVVEGYILGADYFAARDALITALETEGPGPLVHPYHGTKRVVVDGEFRLRETSREGGIVRFTVPFFETPGKPIAPSVVPDQASKVAASAVNARTSAVNDFLQRYSPGASMASITNALRSATTKINGVIRGLQFETESLALVKKRVLDFSDSIAALIEAPGKMVDDLVDIFSSFDSNLLHIYVFDPTTRPPGTTATRLQEQVNFDATTALIRQLALVRAAEVAPAQTYDSFQAAIAAVSAITDKIDVELNGAPDATYTALNRLRADLVNAVPGPASDLAQLISYTPIQTVPSLVLAHRLYGSVSMEADIIARNTVTNPGFIRGGRPLQVLSDGA